MPNAMRSEVSLDDLPVLPHPSLIVDSAELESLRATRKDPIGGKLYERLIARVEEYMDPAAMDVKSVFDDGRSH